MSPDGHLKIPHLWPGQNPHPWGRQNGVNLDFFLLYGKSFRSLLEPITLACKFQKMTTMQQAVKDGRSRRVVVQQLQSSIGRFEVIIVLFRWRKRSRITSSRSSAAVWGRRFCRNRSPAARHVRVRFSISFIFEFQYLT